MIVIPLVIFGLAGLAWVVLANEPGDKPPPAPTRNIIVQNKVAIGPNELVEDATPAYLSAQAVSYCANKNCKVDGTDLKSGDNLETTCYVHGEKMYNYSLDSQASANNPNKFQSDLWYQARHSNGKTGYISEVYIEKSYRGGQNLPMCLAAS